MKLIYDVPKDAPQYLCTDAEFDQSDAELNAALPNAATGTLVVTAGYRKMKQKNENGEWVRLDYQSSPGGWVNPSDATATADDILSGKTAYIADGTKATGTISSKSAHTYTPGTSDQTIDAGQYLSGDQTIEGDANLVAENIKSGVTIFGVVGTYTGEEEAEETP